MKKRMKKIDVIYLMIMLYDKEGDHVEEIIKMQSVKIKWLVTELQGTVCA